MSQTGRGWTSYCLWQRRGLGCTDPSLSRWQRSSPSGARTLYLYFPSMWANVERQHAADWHLIARAAFSCATFRGRNCKLLAWFRLPARNGQLFSRQLPHNCFILNRSCVGPYFRLMLIARRNLGHQSANQGAFLDRRTAGWMAELCCEF